MTIWRDVHLSKIGSPSLISESKRPGAPVEADESANADDITHTVTSGTPENRDGQFNTPLPGKGTTFSFTFSRAGTYTYFCDRHQSMRGEIRVK